MTELRMVACVEARDFDGAVYVEDDGTVRAGPEGAMPWECRALRQYPDGNGYLRVWLTRDGKGVEVPVHRLVAEHHVPGFRPDWDTHHLDRCTTHDDASNLVCLPHSEHTALHTKDRRRPRGEEAPWAKLTDDAVREMRRRRAAGETYRAIAAAFGVSNVTAWKAITGRTWSHLPN